MEEQDKEGEENTVVRMIKVVGEIDRLLEKHNMYVRIGNGMRFDEDEYGRVRVRLSIAQKCTKKED